MQSHPRSLISIAVAALCVTLASCGGGSDSVAFDDQATSGDTGAKRGVLSGAQDPQADIGVDGDFYLNYTTVTLFGPKATGAWPTGVTLRGTDGAAGPAGP